MLSALTIVLFAFAVLLCVGGAAFPYWLAAGALACGWQFIHTVATGFSAPPFEAPPAAELEVPPEDV